MARAPRNPRRSRSGFSLLELLVVLAVLSVVFSLVAITGRTFVQRASERSVVDTFQQAVWQGATSAAARGFRTELVLDGNELTIRRVSTGDVLRRFELDGNAAWNLDDGQVLVFTPPGAIDEATLDALPDPIEIVAAGTTYQFEVSLIGEVRVR
jgi:prepilin-type N-terminal cleavage/methylation domain-containing protein